MASKPLSWKAVITQRGKEIFVGRRDQLRVFSENFTGDVPKYMVFALTGEGGVGKSTLLKQFTANAQDSNINAIVIYCDDRQPSPIAVIGRAKEVLAAYGLVHKELDDRYKTYCELRQEVESDPKMPRGVVDMLALGLSDLTIKSLRKTPGVGVFLEDTDPQAAGEALAQIVNWAISRWGNKDEVQLLREPERILTPLFVELLGKACEKRRVFLMFDVFERTGDLLSQWLLSLFNFEYGEFNTNLTFVVSGRDPLEQHWTELAGAICNMRLEPFTPEETRQYLGYQGITDEGLCTQIHNDTGGLPVLVQLLAATNPQLGEPLPDISRDAVERFLQWTPEEERRQAALLAAVPRQFNRDILTAALGSDATQWFNWLSAQSYVRTTTERGSFYHEKVRELMLRHLRNTTPSDLALAHVRLAEHFAAQQNELKLDGKAAYHSDRWRAWECERVYHSISTQPDRNIPVALNAFFHAFRWRWGLAQEIVPVCKQAGQETGSQTVQQSAKTMADVYTAYEGDQYELGIERLGPMQGQDGLTTTAQCEIHALLGYMFRRAGKNEQALSSYSMALRLDDTHAWALALRGGIYLSMGKYDQALADFDRASVLDDKDVRALALRGVTYTQVGKYDLALADLDRAIELDDKNAVALPLRGGIYLSMGKYDQALADFDRALALDDKNAAALASRGGIYLSMGKYDQALADFGRVIELNDKSAGAFALRGQTFIQMGKNYPALADFNRALELDDKLVVALRHRGETYVRMGRYDLALADFNHAVELDPKDIAAYNILGDLLARKLDRPREAEAVYSKVIELNPEDTATYEKLGELLSNDPERAIEAEALYRKIIELEPEDAYSYNSLGWFLLVNGRFDEAEQHFDEAIRRNAQGYAMLFNLGLLRALTSNRDKAQQLWQQALDLYTGNNEVNHTILLIAAGQASHGISILQEIISNEGIDSDDLRYVPRMAEQMAKVQPKIEGVDELIALLRPSS